MAKIHFFFFDIFSGTIPCLQQGLASIFGILKKNHHEVSLTHIIDNNFETIEQSIKRNSYDLIALSFTTSQKQYVRKFLDTVAFSKEIIIAGGVHCTILKEEVFNEFPEIDGICIGDGEFPLLDLCQRIDSNKEITSVPSFYFRGKSGIIKNPISPLQDINKLAIPDFSLFNYQSILHQLGSCFPIMLARGCPFNCSYCCNHIIRQVYPNKAQYTRVPTVERAIKIIVNNLSLYPETKKIRFYDETFTLNKDWLFEFLDAYKTEVGLPFICDTKFQYVNDDVISRLKTAGCQTINFGLESGNEWLREHVLHRKYSNKKIKEKFLITKKFGIKTCVFNIVGLPFESHEMIKDTLNLNKELRPNFGQCYYFYPFPGTKIHNLCRDYDLIDSDIDSLSGFMERPSIKAIFNTHKDMKKYRELLNTFFFTRLLLGQTKIPFFLEKVILSVLFLFRSIINVLLLDPRTQHKTIIKLRGLITKMAMRFMR